MYITTFVEDLNTPAVALCNKDFLTDAKSAASGKGMPSLRIVPENVPCECNIIQDIEVGISEVIDDIISALIQPLTDEEKSPKQKDLEKLPRISFKGSIEEVHRFFYKRGWGDGLPIIPPTEETVREMLIGTDLPADYVVGKIIPLLGKATVEKIAINAVMAGALPTHMPLLIAAVEALMDPRCHFGTYEVSTGSWSPFWIINGPVRNDLNINTGTGALSPGNIANAAIGRAMGLIIKNIGGARKGIEDMGVFGNPGKYSMVIGENEEQSRWEPLHVENGFKTEDSTISLFFPNSFLQVWPYGTDDKGILRGVTSNIIPGRRGLFCLMLTPHHAKILAQKGWTKKEIANYISEYARVPAYRHPDYWGGSLPGKMLQHPPLNPEDSMSILWKSEWIRVLVAGGPGAFIGLLMGGSQSTIEWVTKKVKLPANWNTIVAKYKDIEPTKLYY